MQWELQYQLELTVDVGEEDHTNNIYETSSLQWIIQNMTNIIVILLD